MNCWCVQRNFEEIEELQYLRISETMESYYYTLKSMFVAAAENNDERVFNGLLLGGDAEKREDFLFTRQIPPFNDSLMEYLILLEWYVQEKEKPLSQMAIYHSLFSLEKILTKTSCWDLVEYDNENEDFVHRPICRMTAFETNMMEQTVSMYIVDKLETEEDKILFFPLENQPDPDVLITRRILEKIATVKITDTETIYERKLKEYLKIRVKSEVEKWLQNEMAEMKVNETRRILEDIKDFTKALTELDKLLTSAISDTSLVERLFTAAGCSYWDSVAEAIDAKLFIKCEAATDLLNVYNTAHKAFHVNMRESSVLCHALFLRVKNIVSLLNSQTKTYKTEKLNEFDSLFTDAFLHLLHVVKTECHSRIHRAVQDIDRDSVLEEQCIMSSTVIVLNCLYTVLDEWKQLQIEKADTKITFLVKITEVLCDGCKIFAENMEQRATNFSYSKEPNIARKICVLGNSIQHVRDYISELPKKMEWENSLKILNDGSIQLETLRLLNEYFKYTLSHLDNNLNVVCEICALYVRDSNEKFLNAWLKDQLVRDPRLQNVDRFLATLHEELDVINNTLKDKIFIKFLKILWLAILNYIKDEFQEGKQSEYAKIAKRNTEEIHKYFASLQIEESEYDVRLFEQMFNILDLNSKSTVELQLHYYGQLADVVASPEEHHGHLVFQAGYKKSGLGTIDLIVKVDRAKGIPIQNYDTKNVLVKVEFCPELLFPSLRPVKTKIATKELENPVFDETFELFYRNERNETNEQSNLLREEVNPKIDNLSFRIRFEQKFHKFKVFLPTSLPSTIFNQMHSQRYWLFL